MAPPAGATETHGVPNSWIDERLPGWTFTADSNKDGDARTDRDEYFLGTDPDADDDLRIEEWIGPRVRLHKVQLGRRDGERVELLQALPPGAQVVLQGAGFLNDGDLVRVVAAPAVAPLKGEGAWR